MGIGQPQQAVLSTLPLEVQQKFLLDRMTPQKPQYKSVNGQLLRIDGNGVSVAYGQPQLSADQIYGSITEPDADMPSYAVGGAAQRADSFTGLNPEFRTRVDAMVNAAAAEGITLSVTSAYRSPELQAQLYQNALAKYGSEAEARRWVAPPGHSMHNKGLAVDFGSANGGLLRDANSPEAQWIKANAGRFGLHVPLSNEPWQVEMQGTRGGPAPEPLRQSAPTDPLADIDRQLEQWISVLGDPRLGDGGEDEARQRIQTLRDRRGELIAQARTSEAERELERLVSAGIDRNTAILIKEGVLKAVRDPITGETTVVNLATGQPVNAASATPSGTMETLPTGKPELSFGDRFDNASDAFGVGGAVRGVVNTAADVIGAPVPFPEAQEALSDFSVFREGLVNSFASAYGRQPPSWLLQRIDDLAPRQGSVWEGPQKAQSKLRALVREMESRKGNLEQQTRRKMSPTARQEVEGQMAGIDAVLMEVQKALGGFSSEQQQTSNGVTWRVK